MAAAENRVCMYTFVEANREAKKTLWAYVPGEQISFM